MKNLIILAAILLLGLSLNGQSVGIGYFCAMENPIILKVLVVMSALIWQVSTEQIPFEHGAQETLAQFLTALQAMG
jgi:hypothetical protein